MTSRFSLITIVVISLLSLTRADDDGHHHHVIIHVPYKVHTIHHTIVKHVHHHDKGGEDKYEVIGYTIGKPLDLGHHFGGGHEQLHHHQPHQELGQHDFGGGNELGHGHDWAQSYGQHSFGGGGGGGGGGGAHLEGHSDAGASHEFVGHGGYGGYD